MIEKLNFTSFLVARFLGRILWYNSEETGLNIWWAWARATYLRPAQYWYWRLEGEYRVPQVSAIFPSNTGNLSNFKKEILIMSNSGSGEHWKVLINLNVPSSCNLWPAHRKFHSRALLILKVRNALGFFFIWKN